MDKDNFPPSPSLLSTTPTKPAGDLATHPLLTGYRRPHCFSQMSVRNITPARKWLGVPPSRLVGPAPLSCIVRSFCFVVLCPAQPQGGPPFTGLCSSLTTRHPTCPNCHCSYSRESVRVSHQAIPTSGAAPEKHRTSRSVRAFFVA